MRVAASNATLNERLLLHSGKIIGAQQTLTIILWVKNRKLEQTEVGG